MNIAILGAGAIGQLLAHQLAKAGAAPTLLLKAGKPCSASQSFGCLTPEGESLQTFSQCTLDAPASAFTHCRLLLVTLKAYQVLDALQALLPKLPLGCHILLLHNGLGPHSKLQPRLDGRGLSLGTTSQGALRLGPHQIRHTGKGLTQLGHFAGPALADNDKALLLRAIPGSEWLADILPALWGKLAVNAAINPLTALDDVPNGRLAEAAYQPTIDAIIHELVQVAAKEGLQLQAHALLKRVRDVIELTADNSSSMRQDLLHGRPSEIDAINGYLVQLAQRHGLELPINQKLTRQIKQREAAL
ncbi:ketopantoate reductase family protein [Shewanella sp. YIC-542]|uniref:ketopantoate reductase family protein n=1 Tax=Shewanella mytili TaxID=3377111 RepID=UPI00398F71A2